MGRDPKKTLIRCIVLAAVSFLLFGFWLRPVRIQGISMEPTLRNGGIHFINLLRFRSHPPQRGDLVAIAMPGGRTYYMKRVLALPGEMIAFDRGVLLIDGRPFEEGYVMDRGQWTMAPTLVPPGHYFVAGDNRQTSFSGHTLGMVEERLIEGAFFR